MAIVAHWCCACHQMSGMVNAAAIAAPARNQRFSTSRRPPVSRAPASTREAEEADAVLVRQAEAEDDAARQPPAAVAGPPDPGHDERQRGPGQHVERRRPGQVIDGQQGRHRGGRDRGQQLRAAAAAELPRGQPGHDDRGPGRQRGPHPQPGQRHAEQLQRHPGQQRRQHRLVDVAGLQVPARSPGSTARRGGSRTGRTAPSDGEKDAADDDHAPVERHDARYTGKFGRPRSC